eukprot:Selendium_serpulae@DN5767_c0_g1_i10.p1
MIFAKILLLLAFAGFSLGEGIDFFKKRDNTPILLQNPPPYTVINLHTEAQADDPLEGRLGEEEWTANLYRKADVTQKTRLAKQAMRKLKRHENETTESKHP